MDAHDEAVETVRREVRMAAETGRHQLEVHFPLSVELASVEPNATLPCFIPLVTPVDGELARNQVSVTTRPEIEVVCGEPWSSPRNGQTAPKEPGTFKFQADDRVSEVQLGLTLLGEGALKPTFVDTAWIQTWMFREGQEDGKLARRDRAVFRLESDRRRVVIDLPHGVNARKAEYLLDGQPTEPEVLADRTATLELPTIGGRRVLCLDVRYTHPGDRIGPGKCSIELPQLRDVSWGQRLYWELVLPDDQHIIVAPQNMTPEYRWGWTGLFWGRTSLLDQRKLEELVGSPNHTLPPSSLSRYLFSAPSGVESCSLRVATRSWIVLSCSGLALAVGLMLIYLPAVRHPAVLMAGSTVLLVLVILYPGPAVLLAQAAAVGIGLAILAGFLDRGFGGRRRRVVKRETSSSVLERGSTQILREPEMVGNQSSTQSAPAAVPAPTPGPHP
jgi:hypothetical protein